MNLGLRTAPEEELEERPRRSAQDLLADRIDLNEAGEDVQNPSQIANIMADPTIEAIFEIMPEELASLTPQTTAVAFPEDRPLGELRTSHHAMAQQFAAGADVVDISRIFGISILTLKLLEQAPAFLDLIAAYKDKDPETTKFSLHAKMEALAHDALDEQRNRLDRSPAQFTPTALRELSGDLLDRTGHGKVSKSLSLHMGLDSDELKGIKATEPQLIGSSKD